MAAEGRCFEGLPDMKKTLLVAGAILTVLAGPALAQQRACLRIGEIYNWNALDDKTLIVEDNWHKKFKLRLIGTCYNLKFHEALAFRSRGSLGISCLDPGDSVIQRDFAMGASRCAITSIDYYTPEEEAADKAAAAAKKAGGGSSY
jgi:hypothetical protein